MKQIGEWFVGTITGGKRLALTRNARGECYSVVQPVGGGPFCVTRFKASEEAFKVLLEDNGDFNAPELGQLEIIDAMEVPAGLADALLA